MKTEESSWAMPFGDLMSLLLAVFVLITAMSELRPGQRFDRIGNSVRGAFGAQAVAVPSQVQPKPPRPKTLTEQLELALAGRIAVRLRGPNDERLAPCEVIGQEDRIVIRVAEDDAFMGPTAVPALQARKLVAAIADHLREGQARLVVRGYGPDGILPPGIPYRDRLEVSCERARVVARELVQAGVAESRVSLEAAAEAADGRGVEVLVYSSPAKGPAR